MLFDLNLRETHFFFSTVGLLQCPYPKYVVQIGSLISGWTIAKAQTARTEKKSRHTTTSHISPSRCHDFDAKAHVVLYVYDDALCEVC